MKLASIFTDHMVLQAHKPIMIFGEGIGCGEISFQGRKYKICSKDDNWCVELQESEYGGPFEMKITLENELTVLTDIYIGEVWIAAGQSNMEMPLFRTESGYSDAKYCENEMIRFFTVPRRVEKNTVSHGWHFEKTISTDTPWTICNEESALHFSAIGFYSAQRLQKELGVAVGIISCNWGGMKIETFIERKYFYTSEVLLPIIKEYDEKLALLNDADNKFALNKYISEMEAYCKKITYNELKQAKDIGIYATNNFEQHPPVVDFSIYSPNIPGCLFDSMFKRIVPYGVKGFLWYQGESNNCKSYLEKYMIFVDCMRENFRDANLPFYAVELAAIHDGNSGFDDICGRFIEDGVENWAFIREQQQIATVKKENCYLVTNMDLGELYDVHPKRKSELSRRIVLKILKHSYGMDIYADEPRYIYHKVKGNKIYIKFKNAEGLFSRQFANVKMYVADESKKLELAQIKIEEDTLILHSEKVEKPVLARFAFDYHYNGAHIFNKAGLPIAPFRTDIELNGI